MTAKEAGVNVYRNKSELPSQGPAILTQPNPEYTHARPPEKPVFVPYLDGLPGWHIYNGGFRANVPGYQSHATLVYGHTSKEAIEALGYYQIYGTDPRIACDPSRRAIFAATDDDACTAYYATLPLGKLTISPVRGDLSVRDGSTFQVRAQRYAITPVALFNKESLLDIARLALAELAQIAPMLALIAKFGDDTSLLCKELLPLVYKNAMQKGRHD